MKEHGWEWELGGVMEKKKKLRNGENRGLGEFGGKKKKKKRKKK